MSPQPQPYGRDLARSLTRTTLWQICWRQKGTLCSLLMHEGTTGTSLYACQTQMPAQGRPDPRAIAVPVQHSWGLTNHVR